jgi:hypothetical protein
MIGHRRKLIARGATLVIAVTLALATACSKSVPPLEATKLRDFASAYALAWGTQDPAKVAACFAPTGSFKINDAEPAIGREAIAAKVKQYMTAFPDLGMKMDELSLFEGDIVLYWTLTGRNSAPGGTGKLIRISGSEEWTIGPDGLIAASKGTYDEAEYQRQLQVGVARGK